MNELSEMGFDFISSYVQNLPVYLNRVLGMKKVIAVGKDFKMNRIQELEGIGADVIEAVVYRESMASIIQPNAISPNLFSFVLNRKC